MHEKNFKSLQRLLSTRKLEIKNEFYSISSESHSVFLRLFSKVSIPRLYGEYENQK